MGFAHVLVSPAFFCFAAAGGGAAESARVSKKQSRKNAAKPRRRTGSRREGRLAPPADLAPVGAQRCCALAALRCSQTICKPGSVPGFPPSTIIPLGCRLPGTSSNQPGRRGRFLPCGFRRVPSLFGLAPGGVCHAASVTRRAVRRYRTVSPLPVTPPVSQGRPSAVCSLWHCPWGRPRRVLPGTVFRGARTFLPRTNAAAIARSSDCPRWLASAAVLANQ